MVNQVLKLKYDIIYNDIIKEGILGLFKARRISISFKNKKHSMHIY